jgi:hypothetical protein
VCCVVSVALLLSWQVGRKQLTASQQLATCRYLLRDKSCKLNMQDRQLLRSYNRFKCVLHEPHSTPAFGWCCGKACMHTAKKV